MTQFLQRGGMARQPGFKTRKRGSRGSTAFAHLTAMHPAAVNHYLAAIEILAQTVKAGVAFGAESKTALRDLIATVTVHPAPAGTNPEISIEGHLTKMIGGDHFPNQKAWGERW